MELQVSYTIPLNQLHLHVPTAEDFQTEFSLTSNVRSCTLRARWRTLHSYIALHCALLQVGAGAERLAGRPELRYRGVPQSEGDVQLPGGRGGAGQPAGPGRAGGECAGLDTGPAGHHVSGNIQLITNFPPLQRPLQACNAEFSLVARRHHCRACGKVVCAPCSANKAPLRYRQFESCRVCDTCYQAVEKRESRNNSDLNCKFLAQCTGRISSCGPGSRGGRAAARSAGSSRSG